MSDKLIEAVAKAIHAHEAARIGNTRAWSSETTFEQDLWLGDARAALSAIEASGYAVVPIYPTREMSYAAPTNLDGVAVEDIYAAMLSARPKVTS